MEHLSKVYRKLERRKGDGRGSYEANRHVKTDFLSAREGIRERNVNGERAKYSCTEVEAAVWITPRSANGQDNGINLKKLGGYVVTKRGVMK
jgi:hypothetical protein